MSGRLAATCDTQESTLLSHAASELPHSPALAKAAAYFASTVATQSLNPEESPVLTTFARHANLPLSFFPIAFSFPATHLSQSAMVRRQTDWNWVNYRFPSGPPVISPLAMEIFVIVLGTYGELW